jgi:hypothetical protein
VAWLRVFEFERVSGVDASRDLENLKSFGLPSCPLLPELARPQGPAVTRDLAVKEAAYYHACLCYAQSLWREGKPAQAILQLNKSFMADLGRESGILLSWPPPYAVLVWMLRNRGEGDFIGNPVRHFQHLATRVGGERKEIRSWRAWACFHLSRRVLPTDGFPIDAEQVEKESLEIPEWSAVLDRIAAGGWVGEAEVIREAAEGL